MKRTLLVMSAALALFAACKKDDKGTPTPGGGLGPGGGTGTGTGGTTTSSYYYSFNFGGKDYNITGGTPQYMFYAGTQLGGWQTTATSLYPSPSLEFFFEDYGAVPDSTVRNLAGQTFYFDANAKVHPYVTFQKSMDSTNWDTYDTLDHQFYVKVDSVRYLFPDTSIGYPLDVYVISGSCNALLTDWKDPKTLVPFTNGKFHFVISRRVLD